MAYKIPLPIIKDSLDVPADVLLDLHTTADEMSMSQKIWRLAQIASFEEWIKTVEHLLDLEEESGE